MFKKAVGVMTTPPVIFADASAPAAPADKTLKPADRSNASRSNVALGVASAGLEADLARRVPDA